jgi:hypothetical protein
MQTFLPAITCRKSAKLLVGKFIKRELIEYESKEKKVLDK